MVEAVPSTSVVAMSQAIENQVNSSFTSFNSSSSRTTNLTLTKGDYTVEMKMVEKKEVQIQKNFDKYNIQTIDMEFNCPQIEKGKSKRELILKMKTYPTPLSQYGLGDCPINFVCKIPYSSIWAIYLERDDVTNTTDIVFNFLHKFKSYFSLSKVRNHTFHSLHTSFTHS